MNDSLDLGSAINPATTKQAKMHSQLIPSAAEVSPDIIESNVIQKEILQGTSGHRTKSMVNCSKPIQLTAVEKQAVDHKQKLLNDEPLIGSSTSGDANATTQMSKFEQKECQYFRSKRDEILQ